MNKSNKFRVWCRDYNEWEKDSIFLSQNGEPYHYLRGNLVLIKPDKHVIQFFTGILDSQGRAIYEGDLLEGFWTKGQSEKPCKESSIFEVKWNDWSNGWHKYYQKPQNKEYRTYPHWDKCKIIGNIFQNPELLK